MYDEVAWVLVSSRTQVQLDTILDPEDYLPEYLSVSYDYDFYSHLSMEDMTYVDYWHEKKLLKQKFLENIMIFIFKVIHYC